MASSSPTSNQSIGEMNNNMMPHHPSGSPRSPHNNTRQTTTMRKRMNPNTVIVAIFGCCFLFAIIEIITSQKSSSSSSSLSSITSLTVNIMNNNVDVDKDHDVATTVTATTTTATATVITSSSTAATAAAVTSSSSLQQDQQQGQQQQQEPDDELASSILKGEKTLTSYGSAVKFHPGMLDLTEVETLKLCYVNTSVYKYHLRSHYGYSKSDKYKLIYPFIQKSGSSTARAMLSTRFEASEGFQKSMYEEFEKYSIRGKDSNNYTIVAFVRDPLSRFFSSYDEAYQRSVPWHKTKRNKKNADGTSKWKHPYPYLHEGMNWWSGFINAYCGPPESRTNTTNCDKEPTKENGTLAERFTKYVWSTDNMNPFDVHLQLQVPSLFDDTKTGKPYHIDEIYGGTTYNNTDDAWYTIAARHGVNLSEPVNGRTGVFHGRSAPRRVNKKYITDETQRHICHMALIDYCCLNLPLPPICQRQKNHTNDSLTSTQDDALYCKLDYSSSLSSSREANDDDNDKQRGLQLQIQPWTFPSTKEVTNSKSRNF